MRHCTIVVNIVVLFHENDLFCFISYLKKKTYFGMFFFLPKGKPLLRDG